MKTSAPGKLFLTGEYAVLEGAPALLTPVPQRAHVGLASSSSSMVESSVMGSLPAAAALESMPLLVSAARVLGEKMRIEGHTLTLDTSAFFHGNTKLGLGSSAALTAALVKLFEPDPGQQQALAMACHSDMQGGRGSGADIALSLMDQPVVFQAGGAEPVELPADLFMLAIWSGRDASTPGLLNALGAWQQAAPADYRQHLDQLSESARHCVQMIRSGTTSQILATIEQYDRHLEGLSKVSGLDFYIESHLAMRKRVELRRCIYKPSGAGGGDFGIAFSADKNDLITLAHELEQDKRYAFFL